MSKLPELPSIFSSAPNSRGSIRAYRTGALQDYTKERAFPLLATHAIKHPKSIPYALQVASILELGRLRRVVLDTQFFMTTTAIETRIREIESYPTQYGSNFLDVYYNEFVTYQNNVENKWTTESIILEVLHGKMIHTGAICIGKVVINKVVYLIVGHDKNHSGGRASTADHRGVIRALKSEDFDRVVYWVDTPGADSGMSANATHQAACMSELITNVCTHRKPSVTVLAGEGGSGGAEVFFGSDMRVALPRSYFSTIHPIGHSAISKGTHSPKELSWMLEVDAFHLAKKGVVDAVSSLSIEKNTGDSNMGAKKMAQDLARMLEASFEHVEKQLQFGTHILQGDKEQARQFLRGLTLRAKTAGMLSERPKEIKKIQDSVALSKRYEYGDVTKDFVLKLLDRDRHLILDFDKLRQVILGFFIHAFERGDLTKFNVVAGAETLLKHISKLDDYSFIVPEKERNNAIGFLKSELYNYQFLFETMSFLIDPSHYDRFFSVNGKGSDSVVSKDKGLHYEKHRIDSFLRLIFDASKPRYVYMDYASWKHHRFQWLRFILDHHLEELIKLAKEFKSVHYNLPDTIVPLAILLLEKFCEASIGDEYLPNLLSSEALHIDYQQKAQYELIRYYEQVRSAIFRKVGSEELERKFFESFEPIYPNFKRTQITPLQEIDRLKKNPNSAVHSGFGRMRDVEGQFGVIMLNFSVEGGAIDAAAAANIIRIIELSADKKLPVIMFLQSAGMFVDAGPESVSSMSAINFAIAQYFKKTAGIEKCRIFSVPFGVCTGGTAASFAQAPGVIVVPIGLSEIPFAGRIVTLEQLPLESTIVDMQVGKGVVQAVVQNPFLPKEKAAEIYDTLKNSGLENIVEPTVTLAEFLRKILHAETQAETGKFLTVERMPHSKNTLFRPFERVAVLNRGVIANKAMQAMKKMGVDYRMMFTDADANLPYIVEATEIGKALWINDYMMNGHAIIRSVKDSGCDAVYLGYGFYSERDDFIALCETHGIVVIGPTSDNVERMGDKIRARTTFKEVLRTMDISNQDNFAPAKGSDDILGGDGIVSTEELAIRVAEEIGYPVMIKAVYGGGGKGIRKIYNVEELKNNFSLMSEEALVNFGNASMYIEKALENQRHIEVQIFSDISGRCVAFGVRDCTTQRKRQKFIEETGDLGIPKHLTQELQDLCASVAKSIEYVGAGTFEFLYDPESQKFTFMEMNTRIQVEHTITERLVQESHDRKINLVELQFLLASGQTHKILEEGDKLQKNLERHGGHALEIRICAEDPTRNFTGKEMAGITNWTLNLPKSLKKLTRFETFLTRSGNGKNHTSKYDSMIGQLIVSGNNRRQAITNAIAALTALEIEGIPTNKELALRILKSGDFQNFKLRIDTLDKKPDQYFEGLTPFEGKVEYISSIKEDIVILTPGELVIRTNQATKISRAPDLGTLIFGDEILGKDGKSTGRLFELVLAKNNTQITPEILRGETFYLKNSTGEVVSFEQDVSYTITRVMVQANQQIGRGQAIFAIKPTNEII